MVKLRHGERADLTALTAIYNYFVEKTAITFDLRPFSVAAREPWLSQFSIVGRYQLFVAEIEGVVAGYASSTRHRLKPAYDTSVEATIYVDPKFARRGIGKALYERLFSALDEQDVHAVFAGIALPNSASAAFHKSFGFREIGVFHAVGRKFGEFHDVLWLEKHL